MSFTVSLPRLLLLAFTLFAVFLDARPAIAPFNDSISNGQEHRLPLSSKPPSAAPELQRQDLSAAHTTFPHKRMMPGHPPGNPLSVMMKMHRVHFVTITSMFPVQAAARFLEDFFAGIATRTGEGGAWSELPEKSEIGFEEGNFRLSFKCFGDTIPWSFITRIAEQLWEGACLGVAELFETVYMDDAKKIGVSVILNLIEDSSGSNSPYDREGSVPSIGS